MNPNEITMTGKKLPFKLSEEESINLVEKDKFWLKIVLQPL